MIGENASLIALGMSAILFAFTVYDRVWGVGHRVASVNQSAKEYADGQIKELRKEVFLKHDTSEGNIGTAIQQMKDMLHKQELDALQARALAAETYMRRDSFYNAMGKLEDNIKDTLNSIDRRLQRIEERDRA